MQQHRRALIPPIAVGLPAWRAKILVTEDGLAHPGATARNAEIALTEDPAFAGAIRYDALRGQVMVCGPLPWARHWRAPRPWTEEDDTRALLWLQNEGIFVRCRGAVGDVVDVVAQSNAYHPIFDYFTSLRWPNSPIWDDSPYIGGGGKPSWLSRYCGVPDTPYTRAVGAGWASIAVARLFDPGCRAPVLVLGGIGIENKSAVFRVLGGAFYGQVSARGVRDTPLERQRASWIIEIANIDHLRRRSEWRGVIDFAARDSDQFSERGQRRRPRPCVFGATTESEDSLPEQAGETHGWYFVRCGTIDVEALTRDRDQFWAEGHSHYAQRASVPEIPNPIDRLDEVVPPAIGAVGREEVRLLRRYLRERVVAVPSCLVEKDELCADYNDWRLAHGLPPINKQWLGRHLRHAGIEFRDYRPDKRPGDDHRHRHYYRGLKVISGGRT